MDALVGVSTIQAKLKDWLDTNESRDLLTLVKPLLGLAPNATPCPATMAEFAPLFQELVILFPNCRLPPLRTTAAIKALHEQEPCIFSTKPTSIVAEEISAAIRQMAVMYKKSTAYPHFFRAVMNKVAGS